MTQEERRRYLIHELQKEMPEYAGYLIPEDERGQRELLRGLFNVRPVQPVSEEFMRVQDEYLQERAREKGITDISDLPAVPADERLILWRGDITTLRCDAILNPANNTLSGCWIPNHSCADNIIQSFAGISVRADCVEYMEKQRKIHGSDYVQPTAVPIITSAYNLPSKYIVHVVGDNRIIQPSRKTRRKQGVA